MAKVILGVALAVAAVSALSKLSATRARNGRLTAIRYTAPSRSPAGVRIVGMRWISRGTTYALYETGEWRVMES